MKGKERTLFCFAAYRLGINPNNLEYNYILCDNKLSLLDKNILIRQGICIVGLETKSALRCSINELGLEYFYSKRNSRIRRFRKTISKLLRF